MSNLIPSYTVILSYIKVVEKTAVKQVVSGGKEVGLSCLKGGVMWTPGRVQQMHR